jgi:hypothetical protein
MIFRNNNNHHETTYRSLAFKKYYDKAQALTRQMVRNLKEFCNALEKNNTMNNEGIWSIDDSNNSWDEQCYYTTTTCSTYTIQWKALPHSLVFLK